MLMLFCVHRFYDANNMRVHCTVPLVQVSVSMHSLILMRMIELCISQSNVNQLLLKMKWAKRKECLWAEG